MSGVTLSNIKKAFGPVEVIHDVNISIEQGEFVVFVGPSGCGKSTLLRMIAGLEETTGGVINIEGQDVTHQEAARRGVSMVFQSYALYPHLTVYDNMAFSLQIARRPKDEIRAKVEEAARILQLDQHLDRKPSQLSGGQRQRVAIGRAIVRQPKVFLFDEPLSNLDAELRVQMRMEIARLHNQIGATMIYVTHDQVEAMTLADKIVVLKSGVVQQIGSPLDLYDNPDNQFVAGFIGSPKMNFLTGTVAKSKSGTSDAVDIRLDEAPNSIVSLTLSGPVPKVGTAVTLGIRPENIETGNVTDADGRAAELTLKTEFTEELGGVSYVHSLTESGVRVTIERRSDRNHIAQDHISARLPTRHLFLFDADGERLR
ncbi:MULTISPECIES: ABC transporter ATP-binding protein [Thalassospira]|uniref:Carbohydrate ABC transporter ATP-binding protein, CUT1 family n=1 Tax=Thalassospira xiamenensis TaxID=220697 RepID=A0A285RKR6_9PROT|nr:MULTISPECIES: sn-glycerol-3-phosphate ABC transporter ATP-binding protein UgpC [Thalassospira]MCH2276274.1 sn-glycerol-3-phosphate ABC transporter ATP-binding protein UgpC [Thalassospira sp.]SOB94683.1 carbohydrate ABC transporter ATP-binding protein, CUT1 family [Thalassospira xiamenensis]